MKPIKFSSFFITIASLFLLTLKTKAGDGRPIRNLRSIYPIILSSQKDTLPSSKKTGSEPGETASDEVIKVVPKARRQSIPIPIGVQVKPIILIKPKIIKPIIRILH